MVLVLSLTMFFGFPLMQEDYSKLCKGWKDRSEITQTEMTICAAEEAKAAEAELEQRYQDLLTGVRQLPSDVKAPELDMSSAIENIKAAQSAWVRYRDAYIDATFPLENKQQEYGTAYSMRVSGIRAEMAREQLRHIKILCEDSVAEWLTPKYCGTR
jgi:uncharacterized protein YecT (DUF1311 family)